jgi:uncharacterized membrane protein YjjP (DUF1212 family)
MKTSHPTKLNLLTEPKDLGALLLDIGVSLLKSGSSCSGIRITMTKFASAYQYVPHVTIGPKSISLTLNDENDITIFNGTQSTPAQGVNFKIISAISRLGWSVAEKKLSVPELKDQLKKLHALRHYPRIITLCFVSLAGASFCYTFGGNTVEMIITFGATFCGLFVRQQLAKYHFNPYICTYLAALAASLFTGAFHQAGLTITLEHAFSTCVLFLVPGVPLINSFTDLIDGNILNGIVKGVNALIHALAIAFGLLTTMLIYNFNA